MLYVQLHLVVTSICVLEAAALRRDEIGPIVCSSEKQLVLTKIPISQYILERLSQVLPSVVYEQWHCIKAYCLQGSLITNEVNSET